MERHGGDGVASASATMRCMSSRYNPPSVSDTAYNATSVAAYDGNQERVVIELRG